MQTVRRGLFCGQGYAITVCRNHNSLSLALCRRKLSQIIPFFPQRDASRTKAYKPRKVPGKNTKKEPAENRRLSHFENAIN